VFRAISKIYLQVILQNLSTYFRISLIISCNYLRQVRKVVKSLISCCNILLIKRKQSEYVVLLRINFLCLILIKYNAQNSKLYF
jgi:hypothetical protein